MNQAVSLVKTEKTKQTLQNARTFFERYVSRFIPVIVLILMISFFYIKTKGILFSEINIRSIINQSVIVAIVATGATFIFASGAFDISLGVATAVSAVLGAKVFMSVGNSSNMILMAAVCVSSGVVILMISSTLSAIFKLPVFIVTIAMMSVLMAIQSNLLGGNTINISSDAIKHFEAGQGKFWIFLVYFVFCAVVFHLTKIGRSVKLLGGNAVSAYQTGISGKKFTFICFLMAGIGVGLGAFLTITRSGSIGVSTSSSLGMDVMIAIVLGGMSISGGARSNIFAATIGTVMVVILNLGLTIMRVDSDTVQAVRGIIFLVMVLVATKRTALLPR